MKLNTIKKVISKGYCLGCGLCHVVDQNCSILEKNGNLISSYNKKGKGHIVVCPAAGYDIVNLGKSIHSAKKYNYELGWFNKLILVQSVDKSILRKASSGGAMTTIALYMLEKGYADGVICTKYSYTNPNSPRPITFIARTKEELLQAQGSKYCPTSPLSILGRLNKDEKYVLIGTPCQIAGWQSYKKEFAPSVNIVLTIANFCGGYRDYRELDYFVHKIAGYNSVRYFQHRGDGVPGYMKIIDENDNEWKYPYPEYAHFSPIEKNKRCVYCVDATGELADISCGDAWIDRIKKTGESWSTLILRNAKAEKLLKEIVENNSFRTGDISEEEVIQSQKLNITSKKYRQVKRIRLRTLLLGYVPNWNNSIKDFGGSYFNECKILLSKFIRNKVLRQFHKL